jgi:hypothetical protein
MKYAGKSYDGQVASVCRPVVVRLRGKATGPRSATIDKIGYDGVPHIRLSDGTVYAGEDNVVNLTPLQFVATKTPEEIDELPERSWTWPLGLNAS